MDKGGGSGSMRLGWIWLPNEELDCTFGESEHIRGYQQGAMTLRREFITAVLEMTGPPENIPSRRRNGARTP